MMNSCSAVFNFFIVVSCVLVSVSSDDSHHQPNVQHSNLRRTTATNTNANANDGILVYEYPALAGQSVDDLINCMMKERHTPDPRKDYTNWHGKAFGSYPPEDIAEYFLHTQLEESFRKTNDPSKASFFFVNTAPTLSVTAGFCNGMNHEDRQKYWKELLEASEHFRERPADHAFICQTWRCATIVRPILKPLVKQMTYMIHENNEQWIGIDEYNMENTVMIPYVAHSEIKEFTHLPETGIIRKHRVTFCGSLKRRSHFRNAIADVKGVFLNDVGDINAVHTGEQESFHQYHQVMRESTFCLVPEGDTPSSRRLFDAMVAGCIPVFLSWGYDKPFENMLDYDSFSFTLNSKLWLHGQAQSQIDELYAMSEEQIRQKKEELAKVVNYINWREGTNVLEGIVDAMLHRRKGNHIVHTY